MAPLILKWYIKSVACRAFAFERRKTNVCEKHSSTRCTLEEQEWNAEECTVGWMSIPVHCPDKPWCVVLCGHGNT